MYILTLTLTQPGTRNLEPGTELAERGGFEPPVPLLEVPRFSKPLD